MLFVNIVVGVALLKAVWDKFPRPQQQPIKLLLSLLVIATLTWFSIVLPGGMLIPGFR